ncbi:MAG TPA: phage tail sheath C-terminal domain-containing protein [Methylomirabilota bacterium]|nr:phage tail sheath C-terminal domain-containing protein [Methylomirabilota bacterium]
MPIAPTFPGVYIEEIPSGVRTIAGVATSITGFVGYTARGLDHRPKRIFSFADFERAFGGLAADSELSYAVQHFFSNGGTEAYVVRVPKHDAVAALITLRDGTGGGAKSALTVTALSKGAWANNVLIDVDYNAVPATDPKAFNLTLTDLATGEVERFDNVTLDNTKGNFVATVVNDEDSGSELVSVQVPDLTAGRPMQTGTVGGDITMADLKNDKDYSIRISADVPAGDITNVTIPFISQNEPIPGSILGVCRLLERKANLALGAVVPGASVRCVPNHTGQGVRLMASFDPERLPDSLDAQLTVAAGTPAANSALAVLKLSGAGTTVNVGHYRVGLGRAVAAQTAPTAGADGTQLPHTADLIGSEAAFTGIYALDKVDLFNLLSIPDATRARPGNPAQLDANLDPNSIYSAAMTFCLKKRAFLLIDPRPEVKDLDAAADWISSGLTVNEKNGAAYFPRVRMPDPLNDFQLRTFAPSGVIAGLYARIDGDRGLWKAPAGTEATLRDVRGLVYSLTDSENGVLNPLGLNCLRQFPVFGHVAWGARTLLGADAEASEWKYVPVRRLALFIEESLYRGTQWVVFEPNDEPLWAQIRLNLGAFMHNLFRQGAFQGTTPRDAYLVKCDRETTTQNDIDRGIVNILVGFAPLKPAEFVIIKIQQLAGQIQT